MIGAHLSRRASPRTVRAVPAPWVSPKRLSAVWIIDPANWDTPPRDSGIHALGWVELLKGWARPSIGVVGRAGESMPWNRGRSHRAIASLVTRS
jgi:hypothetical protein